jgi:hypothetical protein
MKIYIYISDPEGWIKNVNRDPDGDPNIYRSHYIHTTTSDGMDEHGWALIGDVVLPDIEVSDAQLREAALANINREEEKQVAENEVKMQCFEDRRQKLLAITHVPTSPERIDSDALGDDIEDGEFSTVIDMKGAPLPPGVWDD